MKSNIKKVLLSLGLTVAMTASLTACSGGKDDEATYVSQLGNVADYLTVNESYKNMAVTLMGNYSVEDDYLDYVVNYMYSNVAGYVDASRFVTDRAVKDGDMINLDYAGYKDGEAFAGGTAQGSTLWIGSHSFIDGFEDGLIGVMPGETVDLNLTFPEQYQSAELAGQSVIFTCTVNGIITQETIFDTWNTQMAAEGVTIKSFDDMKAYYKDVLTQDAADSYDSDLQNAVVKQLLDATEFKKEFPASLVNAYQAQNRSFLEEYAGYYGTDIDSISNYFFGMTATAYIVDNSYDQLKVDAILQYIADKEGIVLSDEEFEKRLREYVVDMGVENVEEELAKLDENNYRMYFLEDDVMEYLKNNAAITTY